MAVVKLPSGKTVKIPDGKTKEEAIEFLFDNLKDKAGFEEDRKKLGDQLDTSGWGATIGGTIGSVGGALAGLPFGGVGAIPGSIAGGGAGAALGEQVEQWITGKGDLGDVGRVGAEGAAWGAIPGIGGTAAKGVARVGGKAAAQTVGALGSQAGTGAAIGAGGSLIAGTDPKIGAGVGAVGGLLGGRSNVGQAVTGKAKQWGAEAIQQAGKQAGLTGTKKGFGESVEGAVKDIVTGYIKKKAGRPTGAFQTAKGVLDLKRAVTREAFEYIKKSLGRNPTSTERKVIEDAVERQIKDQASYKAASREAGKQTKPRVRATKYKGMDVFEDVDSGIMYDSKGNFVEHFAEGGWVDTAKSAGNLALDFTPIIGDVKAAYEVAEEVKKPNPNWFLVGALGGAALIGLIPGIGDAAAAAIKQGARRGLKSGKGATKKVDDYSAEELPAPFKPEAEDLLDTKERFNVSNLAERAIAGGMDNPFSNAKVTNTGVQRAVDDMGWDFLGKGKDYTLKMKEAVEKQIDKERWLSAEEKKVLEATNFDSMEDLYTALDDIRKTKQRGLVTDPSDSILMKRHKDALRRQGSKSTLQQRVNKLKAGKGDKGGLLF